MRGRINDKVRVQHILESIEEIESAIGNIEFKNFCDDHILRIAVVKWLEIIGEASNHITDECKNKNLEVEWGKIVGLRNFVVHEYFDIDYAIIWDAASVFLKELKPKIEQIFNELD